jgi:hypothetical protein
VLSDDGNDFVVNELPRRLPHQFFFVVQLRIKIYEIDAAVSRHACLLVSGGRKAADAQSPALTRHWPRVALYWSERAGQNSAIFAGEPYMIRYVITVFVIALALGASTSLHASPPIGAAVQTWSYDPKTNSVILKVVNTSQKDITAFNIAITETLADGRVDKHEMLEDLIGKVLLANELQGDHSRGAESFRKLYGDGAFHPGEVHDEIVGVQPGFQKIEAVVDVVTYIDGTAEATNTDALGRIVDEREATVASLKIITETIQTALADPNDTDPSVTAAKKIQDRATIWKAQQHTKIELEPVLLESIADELKTVSSRNTNKRDALKEIVNREEARMSVLAVHAALVKTGGPQ